MKMKVGTAVLIMVCLVVFSFCYGAYRGWSRERELVNETYAGLAEMLNTRVESAYNLVTVASRHLGSGDETLSRVIRERDTLAGKASLTEKATANEQLTLDAAALLQTLSQLDSVKQDSRDQMYVTSYLPQMLAESESLTTQANYNQAAREFNQSLKGSVSGWLARMFGIKPAEQFIVP